MINTMFRAINNKLPHIANLLLLGLLTWIVSQFVLNTWFSQDKQEGNQQAVITSVSNQSSPSNTLETVALFGKQLIEKEETKQERVTAKLNIKLVGTFLGPKPIALVDVSGKTETVGIGEKIMSGVKLLEIHADHLVILHSGKEKTIAMKKEDISPAKSNPIPSLLPTAAPPAPIVNMTNPVAKNSEPNIEDIQSLLIEGTTTLSALLVSKPVIVDGMVKGFQVSPKQDPKMKSLFNHLQLKPYDIITTINGTLITDYANIKDLNVIISSGSTIEMSLKRAGQEKNLSITLP